MIQRPDGTWYAIPEQQEVNLYDLGYSYTGPDAVVTYSNVQSVQVGETLTGSFTLPTLLNRIRRLPGDTMYDPRGEVGWFLVDDAVTQEARIFGLGADGAKLASVRAVYFSDQRDPATALTGVVGLLMTSNEEGLTTERALFTYQEGSFGELSDVPGDLTPAVLYIGRLSGQSSTTLSASAGEPVVAPPGALDEPVLLESTVVRYGTAAPSLYQAQLAATRGDRLLLIGAHSPFDRRLVAVSLDLSTGQWSHAAPLPVPYGLQGYTLSFDPVSGEVLLFGGVDTKGVTYADLIAIQPATLSSRPVRTAAEPPAEVARADAGTFFDRQTRSLYVSGGRRGAVLSDTWRFDLSSHTWRLVDSGTAPGSPGAIISPFVYVEATTQRLWVGDFVSSDPSEGLALHARDRFGQWQDARLTLQRDPLAWPVEGRYVDGRSHLYGYVEPAGTPWPGPLRLARLVPDAPTLGVRVTELGGAPLGSGMTAPAGTEEAAFQCPAGMSCLLEVRPLAGEAQPGGTAFRLETRLAEAVPEASLPMPGQITDLLLSGEHLFVSATTGIRVLDPDSLEVLGIANVHPVRGLARCGTHLCAVKGGVSELVVLDVRDPAAPVLVGRVPSAGDGSGLSVWGRLVYLAEGTAGVGVYDVGAPAAPTWLYTVPIPAGAKAVSVAVGRSLLAVGLEQGRVLIYRLSADPPSLVGEASARGMIQSVRLVNGQLWVLGKHSAWLEGFDLAEPTSPTLLGSVASGAGQDHGQGGGPSCGCPSGSAGKGKGGGNAVNGHGHGSGNGCGGPHQGSSGAAEAGVEAMMRAQLRGPWRYWHDGSQLHRERLVPID